MRIKLHTYLGEGLKRARKDKSEREGRRYSQRDFAEDMDVTIQTIRDWEQDYHLPETSRLLELCDLFQCDLDYLFMKSDVKKHDVEFIMEYTGLSEKAVEKLVDFKKHNPNPTITDTLNKLLLSINFENALDSLDHYLEKSKECASYEKNNIRFSIWNDVLKDRDYLKYETSTRFNYTLDELSHPKKESTEHQKN